MTRGLDMHIESRREGGSREQIPEDDSIDGIFGDHRLSSHSKHRVFRLLAVAYLVHVSQQDGLRYVD